MEENEFGEHGENGGSKELQEAFKQRPWQIQEPEKAKIIFLGLDANWDKDIEKEWPEFFKKTKDYLKYGVKYVEDNWEKNKAHTPMLEDIYNGDGKPYHRKLRELFQELNFSSDDVKDVCLLDLLNVCTYGRSQERGNIKKYDDMLVKMWNDEKDDPKNKGHKDRIQKIFESENNFICIAKGVSKKIKKLKLGLNLERKNIKIHTHFSDHYHLEELKKDIEELKVELLKYLGKN